MHPARTDTLRVPGATLHYQVRGRGPTLLILQGGDGDADGAAGLADRLVDHYTVVTYDRRGLSRSPLDDPVDHPTLATHADDAHRLLAALTAEPALVFGASLGALIGLDLTARHPEQVRVLVAHEPPLPALLPEAERAEVERAQREVEAIYRREGAAAAMRRFAALAGLRFDHHEPQVQWPAPDPGRAANLEFFLRNDAGAARAYRPDLPALRAARGRIVPAAGGASRGHWTHRCAVALADRLGTVVAEFPGGHNGFITHPTGFAARLRELLDGPAAGPRVVDFDAAYTGIRPPWDIGRPQPAFVALAQAGGIKGRVLDVGCGTGEHALLAASLGLEATGVDLAPAAVAMAERKAAERGLTARFLVWNALDLAALGERFDTVLDCGLFHLLSDAERGRFVDGLRAVTRPGGRYLMLCFSDRQPGGLGPRRVTRDEIRACFADGWRVDSIEPVSIDITVAAGTVQAWLATITRI